MLLVDGDVILYRAGFAAERTEYWVTFLDDFDDPCTRPVENKRAADAEAARLTEAGMRNVEIQSRINLEPVENALANVRSMVNGAADACQLNQEDVTVVLSGSTNFRNDLATLKEYKGNRDKTHQPTHKEAMKDYMHRRWKTITTDNEEADDFLGYTQYSAYKNDEESIICTTDKDLLMIPGLHYNPVNEVFEVTTPASGLERFWKQMLTGDSVDNIPGVPGVGPVKAAAALADVPLHEMPSAVYALYVQGYEAAAEDAFLEMGRLVWIRHRPGEIWSPEMMKEYTDEALR